MLHQENFATFTFTGKDKVTSTDDSPSDYWFQKHLNH